MGAMDKLTEDLTVQEGIERYHIDKIGLDNIRDSIFESAAYMDAILTKIIEDPLGREIYNKAEAEVKIALLKESKYESIT